MNDRQMASIIRESVMKVLSEGKTVNHKPYFGSREVYNKYRNFNMEIPGSEYAENDEKRKPTQDSMRKLKDLNYYENNKWWNDETDRMEYPEPNSEYEAASAKRRERERRRTPIKPQHENEQFLEKLRYDALKCGIPANVVRKLSYYTLKDIVKDMGMTE